MRVAVQYHKHFIKKLARLGPKIRKQTKARILLFSQSPLDQQLSNHPLAGKYRMFRSINITGDIRAIFKEQADGTVIFVDIDTHSNPSLFMNCIK